MWSASYSPDGLKFAFVDGRDLHVYGVQSLRKSELKPMVSANIRSNLKVYSLAWSHDNTRIATSGNNDEVVICDATTGAIIVTLYGEGCDCINCVTFSKSDAHVTSVSNNGRVFCWPIIPFSSFGTLDLLRQSPGVHATENFIEQLNLANAWSDYGVDGNTVLHMLAKNPKPGTFWGDKDGDHAIYDEILHIWKESNAPYVPVRNDKNTEKQKRTGTCEKQKRTGTYREAETPLTVAVKARNPYFLYAITEAKDLLGRDFDARRNDDKAIHNLITVRTLPLRLASYLHHAACVCLSPQYLSTTVVFFLSLSLSFSFSSFLCVSSRLPILTL